MLKSITGIAAFVLTFGLSVSLVGLLFGFPEYASPSFEAGSDHRVRHKISAFLERDVRNGRLRDRQILRNFREQRSLGAEPQVKDYFLYVNEYYNDSSSMNDSYLPEDLRYAWREHMKAWRSDAELLSQAARGEITEEHFRMKKEESSQEITDTWFQVLRIAERYGVNTGNFR